MSLNHFQGHRQVIEGIGMCHVQRSEMFSNDDL